MNTMFLSIDTKIKTKIAVAIILSLILNFSYVHAEDASNAAIQAQKNDLQKRLADINRQIQDYQKQIATTQAQSASLKNEILIYDKLIASTELAIEGKQTQIEDTQLQIDETNKLIDQKKQEINDNKKVLGQLIVQLNEFDDQFALKTTIGSDSLSDFLDQVQYTNSYSDKINQLVQKIKDLKTKLEGQEHDLEAQLDKLKELQKELQSTQDSLNEQRNLKQQLLTQTKGQEKNFQKLLTSSKGDQASLQKEVDDLDAQIRAKVGNKTLSVSKGILAWPIDGILTQSYGNTGFTSLGYNFHNGLDIAGPAAAPIYAAADGVVYDTDHSDTQYGNWVAIKHDLQGKSGGIHIITLYGHMRTIIAKPGQKLNQGDLIGYEGNTGNTTKKLYGPERGYHVHFGVYDQDGFGVNAGKYQNIYGPYKVPYGYTYNPLDFLGK